MASDGNRVDTKKPFDYRRTNSKLSSKEDLAKKNTAVSKNYAHRLRAIDSELRRFSQDFEREKTRLLGSLRQIHADKRKDVVGLLKERERQEEMHKVALKDKQDFERKFGELDPGQVSPAATVQNLYLSLPKIVITRTSDERKPAAREEEDSPGRAPRRRRSSFFESLKASLRVPDDPNILDQLKVRNVPSPRLLLGMSVKWDFHKLEVQKELQRTALEHYATRLSKRRLSVVTAPRMGENGQNNLIVVFTNEEDSKSERADEKKTSDTGVVKREPVFSENSPRRRVTVTGTSPSKHFQQAVDDVYKETKSKRKISLDFEPRFYGKIENERTIVREGTGLARNVDDVEDKPSSCPARLDGSDAPLGGQSARQTSGNQSGNEQEKQGQAEILTIQQVEGDHLRPRDAPLLRHEFSVTKLRSTYQAPQKPKLRTRSLSSINMHIRRHSKISTVTLSSSSIELNTVSQTDMTKPQERLLQRRQEIAPGKLVYQHSNVSEFGNRKSILKSDNYSRFPPIDTPDTDSQDGESFTKCGDDHLSPILLNPLHISRPKRRCSPKRVHFIVP